MRWLGDLAVLASHAVLAASPLMAGSAAIASDGIANPAEQFADLTADRQLVFDIPAQPLVSALETYGAISGFQVVYDAALARGRESSEIKGTFAPDAALRRLLAGTGLTPRYMAADGVVLGPDAAFGVTVNTAPPLAVASYYGRVQASLRQAFCAEARVRSGGYRLAVGLWINSSGLVVRSGLLDTTGDPDLDARLERGIRAMNIGASPPAGFAQPIVMTIDPDVAKDCKPIPRQRTSQ